MGSSLRTDRAHGGRGAGSGRLRRLLARAVVVGTAAAAVLFTAQAAYAAAAVTITNSNSGLCLQPMAGSGSIYDNGIPIAQVPCNGSPEQTWTKFDLGQAHQDCTTFIFIPIGRCGFDPVWHEYYIVNAVSHSCMDVTNANSTDRTPIQQWQCNNGGSEKWWLPPSDTSVGMFLPFENVRTGKCLDVPFATLQPVNLWEYHCTTNNVAQVFSVPPS